MIKRCVECKTEKDYPKYFEFCPVCGGKLEKAYNEGIHHDHV